MDVFGRRASPFYSPAHEAFRATVARFVATKIEPFVDTWEDAGTFPQELYSQAADDGILGIGFEERYGGRCGDPFHWIIVAEELSRAGASGLTSALMNHGVALPPIVAAGSEALKARVLPEVLSGRKLSALAVTEPTGGSDVANLKTTAVRTGSSYRINGSKMFITSGMRADYFTVAVRTGAPGMAGISLMLVERGTPGFAQRRLKTMGWACADIAALEFKNCLVPAENLIGAENTGFSTMMLDFNVERLFMVASGASLARVCLQEAAAYARSRLAFGRPLIEKQVIRHKLVDMAMKVNATQAYLESVAWRVGQGEHPTADICMLKNQTSVMLEHCAREAVQIFGGAGYLHGSKVERIYRDMRVNAIGGGTEETMRDFAAVNLGL
jgi:acyl-CoA dehydrogenase